jgi:hypothetical protein
VFCQVSQQRAEWAGNPGFRALALSPNSALPNLRRKIAEGLQPFPQKSPFCETIGVDGFDQHCRAIVALSFGSISQQRYSCMTTARPEWATGPGEPMT